MSHRLRRLQKKNISKKSPMSNTGVGQKVVGKVGKNEEEKKVEKQLNGDSG